MVLNWSVSKSLKILTEQCRFCYWSRVLKVTGWRYSSVTIQFICRTLCPWDVSKLVGMVALSILTYVHAIAFIGDIFVNLRCLNNVFGFRLFIWLWQSAQMKDAYYMSVVLICALFFMFYTFHLAAMCTECFNDMRHRRALDAKQRQELLRCWMCPMPLKCILRCSTD